MQNVITSSTSAFAVYVADDPYGKTEKVVKVAKSKRAAVILYNKLINTDKYFEVGMRVKGFNEGKLKEAKNLKDLDKSTAMKFASWKSDVLILSKKLSGSEKKKVHKDINTLNKLVYNITQTFEKNLDEGKLNEKTVRLSTMKDANFEPGQFVQLMGKKGMVKLDKKSVHKLAKIVRQLSGKKGMGWSFTMGEDT